MSSVAIGEEAPFGNAALIIYRYLLILATPDFTGRLIDYLERFALVRRESKPRGWIRWREMRVCGCFRNALETILKTLLAGVHTYAVLGKALAISCRYVISVHEWTRSATLLVHTAPGTHARARRPGDTHIICVRKHRFRARSHALDFVLHPAIWAFGQALAKSARHVLPPEITRFHTLCVLR